MSDYFLGDNTLDIGGDLDIGFHSDEAPQIPFTTAAPTVVGNDAEVDALLQGTGFDLVNVTAFGGDGLGEDMGFDMLGIPGSGVDQSDIDLMDQDYNFKLFASQETSQLPASRLALAPGLVNLGSAVRDIVNSQTMQRSMAKRRLRGLPQAQVGGGGGLETQSQQSHLSMDDTQGHTQQQGDDTGAMSADPPQSYEGGGGGGEMSLDGEQGGGGSSIVPMGGFLGGGRVVNRWVPKKKQQRKWSAEEDLQFFDGLRQFGTSFNLIAVFCEKERYEVVAKFKLEERKNPNAVQEALNNQLPVNVEDYSDKLKQLELRDARDNARLTDAETLQLLDEEGGGPGQEDGGETTVDTAGAEDDPLGGGGSSGGQLRKKGSGGKSGKRVIIQEGGEGDDLGLGEFSLLDPADDNLDDFSLDDGVAVSAAGNVNLSDTDIVPPQRGAAGASEGHWEDFDLEQLTEEMPPVKKRRLEDPQSTNSMNDDKTGSSVVETLPLPASDGLLQGDDDDLLFAGEGGHTDEEYEGY